MRGKYLLATVFAIALGAVGSMTTAADQGMRPAPESSLEEATRIANELNAQRENPLHHAMRQVQEAAAEAKAAEDAFDREVADRLAAGDEASDLDRDPVEKAYGPYVESLRALGEFQDPERLKVLAPALNSPSKHVRIAALEALRDGTVNDGTVLSQVRGMVTGDTDPSVQRNALEVYVRYGNPTDVLSLVQSLGRSSGPARDIAVREWLRLEKEMADASLADKQLEAARN